MGGRQFILMLVLTLSYFCDSLKKINGKSCQFFLTFPKYVNGRLGTTFYSQETFRVVGRGLKWSKLPQFHKGDPVGSSRSGKLLTKIGAKLYMLHTTSWSRRDMRLGTIFQSKSTTSALNGRGGILRPP